jgi:hypothetical protein
MYPTVSDITRGWMEYLIKSGDIKKNHNRERWINTWACRAGNTTCFTIVVREGRMLAFRGPKDTSV